MKTKAVLINYIARWVVGVDWQVIRDKVQSLDRMDGMSGDEKKQSAKEWIRDFGITLAEFLVNFAIEAALVWARTKATK